ncbi:MAG TPA: nucleotide exchange factor GrpE [Candidatus Angelobacter sp.]|nr:nucleotide exchange factor GrpE [Candidatus Angelobacter sp.]
MQESTAPRLAKWPFFLGSVLLLVLFAWFFLHQTKRPLSASEVLGCIACVGFGAFFIIWPFVLEYRSAAKLLETATLTTVVSQVQNLEQLAGQIAGATAQWQSVQEAADKTARQAKDIALGMAAEAKGFAEFLKQANDNERATLRLEVDKLRRIEAEWLQVLVRILDHVHALNRAAAHSRQPTVIEQLGRFQVACHDAARRVGLMPFIAAPDEKFDTQKHQLIDGTTKAAEDASVHETVASGYTFQGKLLRPAIVQLRNGNGNGNGNGEAAQQTQQELPAASSESDSPSAENELPLA